jgi:hypothetical protein
MVGKLGELRKDPIFYFKDRFYGKNIWNHLGLKCKYGFVGKKGDAALQVYEIVRMIGNSRIEERLSVKILM